MGWIIAIIVVAAVLLGLRLLLNPIATAIARRALAKIPEYACTLDRVAIAWSGMRVRISRIVVRDRARYEPLALVESIEARVLGRELWHGRLAVRVLVTQPTFVVLNNHAAPTTTASAATPQAPPHFDLSDALTRLIPARMDRLEVRHGEIIFADGAAMLAPRIRVWDVELALDNVATRRSLDMHIPSTLTLRAQVQNTGTLTLLAQADTLAATPALSGQAQLENLDLTDLQDFATQAVGVAPRGTFECFVTFNAADGKLVGAAKPMWKNAEIEPAGRTLGAAITARLANGALAIFDDDVAGRNAIATVLPIKGSLTAPDPQVWPTVLGIVRNAFVHALSEGFAHMPAPSKRKAS